ncbi:hypothetical protein C8Q75DRAFT_313315 [Abortiporus biennis]|nr:hypothetical protein C8Q75DRAFT_313315 [Abortiporus biennis]
MFRLFVRSFVYLCSHHDGIYCFISGYVTVWVSLSIYDWSLVLSSPSNHPLLVSSVQSPLPFLVPIIIMNVREVICFDWRRMRRTNWIFLSLVSFFSHGLYLSILDKNSRHGMLHTRNMNP